MSETRIDPPTLYSNEYRGLRWRYGLCYRPLSTGAVPKGWIIWSDKADRRFAYGTIDYPRELTAAEMASYELVFAGKFEYERGDYRFVKGDAK